MLTESKHKVIQLWIPIVMALVAVIGFGATVYFGHQQQENAKASLAVTLALRFDDQFDTDLMRDCRRDTAKALLAGKEPPDDDLIGFFDTVGLYTKRGYVDIEVIWNEFGYYLLNYWPTAKTYVTTVRADDETYFDNAEWLYQQVLKEDTLRHHGKPSPLPTKAELEDFLWNEANLSYINHCEAPMKSKGKQSLRK